MAVRQWGRGRRAGYLLFCLALVCVACAATPPVTRVALLAPFEGNYREVGYDALYAARLALRDGAYPDVELLPLDDGGSAEMALERAQALARNPLVTCVLVMGYTSADPHVLQAFDDLPVIVVGHWGAVPVTEGVFVLTNATIPDHYTVGLTPYPWIMADLPAPLVGGEVFALRLARSLRDDLSGIQIASSAALPDADFTERFVSSDQFVQPPGLLTTLAYDAAHIAAQSAGSGSRSAALGTLQALDYEGLNGRISFENGYWREGPVNLYEFDPDGALVLAASPRR